MSSARKDITVEVSVLLGKTKVPVQRLLKLGRGAIIELDSLADEDLTILANNTAFAQGQIVVNGGVIGIEVTKLGKKSTAQLSEVADEDDLDNEMQNAMDEQEVSEDNNEQNEEDTSDNNSEDNEEAAS